VSIFLAEKEINSCVTTGQCAINDDMAEVLLATEGADVLVLATPLYFDNISGMLKVYDDVANYLQLLKVAGKEIATDSRLSEMTNPKLMEQQFMPDKLAIQIRNSLARGIPPE